MIDVNIHRAGDDGHWHVQFLEPVVDGFKHARIRGDRDQRADAVHCQEFHGGVFGVERNGFQNIIQIFLHVRWLGTLQFEQAHALIDERIAVELRDQIHDMAHVAVVSMMNRRLAGA